MKLETSVFARHTNGVLSTKAKVKPVFSGGNDILSDVAREGCYDNNNNGYF